MTQVRIRKLSPYTTEIRWLTWARVWRRGDNSESVSDNITKNHKIIDTQKLVTCASELLQQYSLNHRTKNSRNYDFHAEHPKHYRVRDRSTEHLAQQFTLSRRQVQLARPWNAAVYRELRQCTRYPDWQPSSTTGKGRPEDDLLVRLTYSLVTPTLQSYLYPDQSIYATSSVLQVVCRINNALISGDTDRVL